MLMLHRSLLTTVAITGLAVLVSSGQAKAGNYFPARSSTALSQPTSAQETLAALDASPLQATPARLPQAAPGANHATVSNPQQTSLSYEQLRNLLSVMLQTHNVGDSLDIVLFGDSQPVYFSDPAGFHYQLENLKLNQASQSFSVDVVITGDNGMAKRDTVSGRYEQFVSVPVIVRKLGDSEVITEDMLGWKKLPGNRLREDTITDPSFLIGKSPKHRLMAQRQIRRRDITLPTIVEEGDLLQINYSSGNMTLSTLGRALQQGAEGDVIRIENIDSEQVIRAMIEEKGRARVAAR